MGWWFDRVFKNGEISMIIDIKVIAAKMIDYGVSPVTFEDWTGTLVDILEEEYKLEMLVREEMKEQLK